MSSLLRPRAPGGTGPSPRSASVDSLSSVLSPTPTSSKSPTPSSQPPPPRDSSLIRFKVTRPNAEGFLQSRVLSLNTKAASLQLSAPTVSTQLAPVPHPRADADSPLSPPPPPPDDALPHVFLVNDIADVEKCHCDRLNNRCILVLFDDVPPPLTYDLCFLDQTTRDIFCELVASMDRQINIKQGCGGIVTSHWVEDSTVRRCMKCGKDFSVALRRHHCRLCGRVFCWACSDNLANLAELGYNKPVRVCGKCFDNIRERRLQGLTVNGTAAHAVGAGGHNYNGQHAPHNTDKKTPSTTLGGGAGGVASSTARKGSGGSSNSASSSSTASHSSHPRINTERLSDADQERIDPANTLPSPSPTEDEPLASPIASPLTLPHLFSTSSASPRGVTPRDGAFREGKRDKYVPPHSHTDTAHTASLPTSHSPPTPYWL